MTNIQSGYVKTDAGQWFVQVADPSCRWGFYLADEDQQWDGGVGLTRSWTLVSTHRVPEKVRERLAWLLDDAKGMKR